jgi:hypothetical protein
MRWRRWDSEITDAQNVTARIAEGIDPRRGVDFALRGNRGGHALVAQNQSLLGNMWVCISWFALL